jgi:hypothetical protein
MRELCVSPSSRDAAAEQGRSSLDSADGRVAGTTATAQEEHMYKGDVSLIEEIEEQDFDGVAYGACSTNTFSLSNVLGNNGGWCTLTKECQSSCN